MQQSTAHGVHFTSESKGKPTAVRFQSSYNNAREIDRSDGWFIKSRHPHKSTRALLGALVQLNRLNLHIL